VGGALVDAWSGGSSRKLEAAVRRWGPEAQAQAAAQAAAQQQGR
jgi:hypothetical protein